jgi:inosose dehydratase
MTMKHTGPRVAANPIPYWVVGSVVDKSKEAFDQAYKDFADIGFTAVKADVPVGMSTADYLTWIDSYGLSPRAGQLRRKVR